MKFPELTQQEIKVVNATPDNDYPLRILRVYRENCNSKWSDNTGDDPKNPMFIMMNEDQDKRAEILDRAIEILEKYM